MSLIINIIFTGVMLILAFIDVKSYLGKEHKDLKSAILSLGILGTFFGIFLGLLGFNTSDIQDSVPKLLEGLKVAFFTSIAGMSIAIILFVFQKFKPQVDDSDLDFGYIKERLKKLDRLDKLDRLEHLSYLEMLRKLEHQKSIDTATQESLKVLQNINRNMESQHKETYDLLMGSFEQVMHSLKVATEEIARGASSEIINALETVIKDFNNNLNEQFGDNFKELNEGVHNLVEWQKNYKSSIETSERSLKLASDSITGSKEMLEQIASKNSDTMKVYQELSLIINTYANQIKTLNAQLQEYERLGQHSQDVLDNIKESFDLSQEKFTLLADAFFTKIDESKNAIQQGIEQLQQSTTASNESLLDHAKALFENTRDNLSNLSVSTTQHISTAFSLLEEKNNHVFTDIARSNTEAMLTLQREQEDITENITGFLQEHASSSRESAETFKNAVETAREDMTRANRESIDNIHAHSVSTLDELKSFYKTSFEEENKNAFEALDMTRDNFNTYIRQSFDETRTHLSSLSNSLKENLENSSTDFQNHTASIRADLDSFIQHGLDASNAHLTSLSTSLKENLEHAGEDFQNHTASIRDSLDAYLRHSFNETTSHIASLNTNLKESLESTSANFKQYAIELKENFINNLSGVAEKTFETLNASQNGLTTYVEKASAEIHTLSKNLIESISSTQESLSNLNESAQKSIEKSFILSTKAHRELSNEADKMLKSLDLTNKEVIAGQKTVITEISSAFSGFTEHAKSQISTLLTSIDEFNTEFTVSNSETLKQTSKSIRLNAEVANKAFEELTQNTLAQMHTILENATAKYISTLERNANEGKDIPLKIAQNIKNSFLAAQKELADYSKSTNSSIYNTKNLVEKLMEDMNKNIASQINQNQTLNEDLLKSLRALDNSMQVVVKNFKNDYDWLLRRIRELMGSDRL